MNFIEIERGKSHASHLNNFIYKILEEQEFPIENLDAIAVSSGPGSYTGLRIGSSTSKGIAYALNIPLIAINTLKIMASGFLQRNATSNEKSLLAPVLDARRNEVFIALYDNNLKSILAPQPLILSTEAIKEISGNNDLIFLGNASKKCSDILGANEAYKYILDFKISSTYMALLAEEKFNNKTFENTSYFEPNYAKAFFSHSASS